MTCSFCGFEYRRDEAVIACGSCPLNVLKTGCGLLRCPRCAYEMPEEPPIIAGIRNWIRKIHERRRIA